MKVSVEREGERAVAYALGDASVEVRTEDAALCASGDAEIALGLLASLKEGSPLSTDLPPSPRLAENAPQLRTIFSMWRDWTPVELQLPPSQAGPSGSGVATFFSGGVDSFYTALTHADEIDTLIFVHGFDIDIEDAGLRQQASEHARAAARTMGKRLVEVETDIRKYKPLGQDWGYTHGAAMALIAHSLAPEIGKVYIPATYTYRDMFPWGSHPLTDPLWAGVVDIVHDAADVTRLEKIELLSQHEAPAKHLRVCWENRGRRFNCCACEKCTRTMIALRVFGALDRFETFDRPLRLGQVRRGVIRDQAQRAFTEQGLRTIAARGTDPDLVAALRWRLRLGGHVYRAQKVPNMARGRLGRLKQQVRG